MGGVLPDLRPEGIGHLGVEPKADRHPLLVRHHQDHVAVLPVLVEAGAHEPAVYALDTGGQVSAPGGGTARSGP